MRRRLLLAALALAAAPACTTVKPWQRELLAQPAMQLASDGETAADQHVVESREGSAGGYGATGGGCGCN